MDARATHSQSPQPSPHGAIGEFPGGISASNSGGVASQHTRASSYTTRPRTPQVSGPNSADGDELDLNALMAHGQRQLEMDTRSRFGRFTATTRADSPSRWGESEWRSASRGARSRDTSMHRQPSTNSLNGGSITPVPTGATTNLSSFLDTSFPSPIGTGMVNSAGVNVGGVNSNVVGGGVGVGGVVNVGRPRPGGFVASTPTVAPPGASGSGSVDPSAAATHHLNALNALLNPLIAQNDEVIRLRAEVELWRGEWQRCDRERRRLESVLTAKNSEPIDGPAFSVVLLDGDGVIFQDEYLREGFAGGQRAARALASALPSLSNSPASNNGEADSESPKRDLGTIIVQVFVNKQGLGHALLKAGSVPSWTVYDGFWQGFTSAHDLFSVVDAGHGKEAADHKIREHLKLYASHRQCGTIFLGASHDNSYANVLSSLETTSGLSKLVLLKGYADVANGLKQYAGRFVTIPDLFRPSRLSVPASTAASSTSNPNNLSVNVAHANANNAGPNSPRTPSTAPKSPAKRRTLVPVESVGEPSDDADSDAELSAESGDDEVEVLEWESATEPRRRAPRARGARADDADDADDTKKKANGTATGKKYKPAARAASLPTVRNLKPRPCHTFYLSPWGCKNGDGCEYAHNYKLNEEQTEELARLAKEIICPYVRSKRCHFSEDECVYGHRCPRGERCTFGDTCRFKDLPNGHGEESAKAAAAAAVQ